MHAKVNPRNISKILVKRTRKDFNYKDVTNIISRICNDKKSCPVEQVLGKLRDEGGEVNTKSLKEIQD